MKDMRHFRDMNDDTIQVLKYKRRKRMFALKYTSTLQDLQKFLDEQFKQYLEGKNMQEEQQFLLQLHYEEEKKILTEQIYHSPEILKDMCFMAFLGHLAKAKKIMVSNVVIQCPFLLFLLGVVSFDVVEEGYAGERYLLEKSRLNTTNYYVDDHFYKLAKNDISAFLEQSEYLSIWIGHTDVFDGFETDREPVGILVVPRDNDILEQKNELGTLYDGNECILEENVWDLYQQGTGYQLVPLKQERQELTEELFVIEEYKAGKMDKKTAIRMIASGMIASGYEESFDYYEWMENLGDQIYSREDLYQYLRARRIEDKIAFYWTEVIRKGTLARKLREHQISYQDYTELYFAIGKERIDLFCQVHYMPTCWSVLEKFYRLINQMKEGKVIAVDFDGTLSLGTWPNTGPANEELIDFLKERKKKGDKLILWTCREGEALEEAVKWCQQEGLAFDAVNDNIPELIERYGTNSRKVSCDYYIDDRAVWTNAFELLK